LFSTMFEPCFELLQNLTQHVRGIVLKEKKNTLKKT
jgi:hypothetical protein